MRGKTHGSEFLVHKYWGRKAYTSVFETLKRFVRSGDVVYDPFCGSGVASVAAARLGATVYATDLNPIACAITSLAASKIAPDLLLAEGDRLLSLLESSFPTYRFGDDSVRYFVHAREGQCPTCSQPSSHTLLQRGRTCYSCGRKLKYDPSGAVRTAIVGAELAKAGSIDDNHPNWSEILTLWKSLNEYGERRASLSARYNASLVDNRRTLTTSQKGVGHYFTPFAFLVLTKFADLVHETSPPALKSALLLVLTSASAQASRLIPYRNNMTTGGPAWSVPGFWIPPVHLECNVFERLRTRLLKVHRGSAQAASANQGSGSVRILNAPATDIHRIAPVPADLIFLDPPYAGDVPYLEFSAIWNAFLTRGQPMTYDKEVVVSDRLAPPSRSSEYELQLSSSLSAVTERLKAGGRIIVTFNNLSSSSWSAMLHPLQMLGFRIERVDLHEPAVKSSKAQFAPDTSYIGDFYIVLRRMEVPLHQTGRSTIEEAIRRLFTLRSGQLVAINRVRAVAIHALLVRNVAAAEFSCIDSVIDALCDVTHAMVSLRDEQPASSSVFTDYLIGLVAAAHSNILTSTLSTETLMAQILQLDAGHTLPTEPELLDSIALYESPRLYLSPA